MGSAFHIICNDHQEKYYLGYGSYYFSTNKTSRFPYEKHIKCDLESIGEDQWYEIHSENFWGEPEDPRKSWELIDIENTPSKRYVLDLQYTDITNMGRRKHLDITEDSDFSYGGFKAWKVANPEYRILDIAIFEEVGGYINPEGEE